MSLQSLPAVTRAREIEAQLYLARNYVEWVNNKYPEIYNEYKEECEK